MPFTKVAEADDLRMLTSVLDEYCRERGIANHSDKRKSIGYLLMSFFHDGAHTPEDLKAALRAARPD